jgi:hypothetical protein
MTNNYDYFFQRQSEVLFVNEEDGVVGVNVDNSNSELSLDVNDTIRASNLIAKEVATNVLTLFNSNSSSNYHDMLFINTLGLHNPMPNTGTASNNSWFGNNFSNTNIDWNIRLRKNAPIHHSWVSCDPLSNLIWVEKWGDVGATAAGISGALTASISAGTIYMNPISSPSGTKAYDKATEISGYTAGDDAIALGCSLGHQWGIYSGTIEAGKDASDAGRLAVQTSLNMGIENGDSSLLGDTQLDASGLGTAAGISVILGTATLPSWLGMGWFQKGKAMGEELGKLVGYAVGAADLAKKNSNALYPAVEDATYGSNKSVWASNAANYGSNTARWSSNKVDWASNIADFASNTADWTSNKVHWTSNNSDWNSNKVYWSSNKSDWNSNKVHWTSNNSDWNSNKVYWSSNTSDWASNKSHWSSNTATAASNEAFTPRLFTNNMTLVYTNSNVAIGKNLTANTKLDIGGALHIDGETGIPYNLTQGAYMNWNNGTTSFINSKGVSGGDTLFQVYNGLGLEKTIMKLDGGGYVGINKTDPAYDLDVNGTINGYGLKENDVGLITKYALSNQQSNWQWTSNEFVAFSNWANNYYAKSNIVLALSNAILTEKTRLDGINTTQDTSITTAQTAANTANTLATTANAAAATAQATGVAAGLAAGVAQTTANTALATGAGAAALGATNATAITGLIAGVASAQGTADHGSNSLSNYAPNSNFIALSNLTSPTRLLSNNSSNVFTNSNVGLGTSTPSERLDIVGGVKAINYTINDGSLFFGQPYNYSDSNSNVPWYGIASTTFNTSTTFITNYYNLQLQAGGGNAFINLNTNGNIGIGTTAPTTRLDINGSMLCRSNITASNASLCNLTVASNITASNMTISNITVRTVNACNLVLPSAGISIGTSNTFPLTSNVITTNLVGTTFFGSTSSNMYLFKVINTDIDPNSNIDLGGIVLRNYNTVGSANYGFADRQFYGLAFVTRNGTNSNREAMNIDHTGRVGIGTSNPVYPLDILNTGSNGLRVSACNVNGDFRASSVILNTASNNPCVLSLLAPNVSSNAMNIVSHNIGVGHTNGDLCQWLFQYRGTGNSSNSLVLGFWGGINSMYWNYGGQVGIGTTNPVGRFDVNGDCRFRSNVTTSNIFSSNITALNTTLSNLTASNIYCSNIGIGTATPAYPLDIVSAGSNGLRVTACNANSDFRATTALVNTASNNPVILSCLAPNCATTGVNRASFNLGVSESTGNLCQFIYNYIGSGHSNNTLSISFWGSAPVLSITNSNCVGIGLFSPTMRLDVNGDCRFRSNVTTSNINTSNLTVVGTCMVAGADIYSTFARSNAQSNWNFASNLAVYCSNNFANYSTSSTDKYWTWSNFTVYTTCNVRNSNLLIGANLPFTGQMGMKHINANNGCGIGLTSSGSVVIGASTFSVQNSNNQNLFEVDDTSGIYTRREMYLQSNLYVNQGKFIEWGEGQTKETNAGRIAYRRFGSSNALDIVGAGTTVGSRLVKVYDILSINSGVIENNSGGGGVYIGDGGLGYNFGTISHRDMTAGNDYAIKHSYIGTTSVNASYNQEILFKNDDQLYNTMDKNGTFIFNKRIVLSSNINADTGGYSLSVGASGGMGIYQANSTSYLGAGSTASSSNVFFIYPTGNIEVAKGDLLVKNRSGTLNIMSGYKNQSSNTNWVDVYASGSNNGYGGIYMGSKLEVGDSFTATSKSFTIKHPINPNKKLIHASVEAPAADLIYSGTTTLVNGLAFVNIDTESCPHSPMEQGTFVALTRNPRFFLQNKTGFTPLKGILNGNILNIIARTQADDVVYWSVIAERRDIQIVESDTTTANGHLITELLA